MILTIIYLASHTVHIIIRSTFTVEFARQEEPEIVLAPAVPTSTGKPDLYAPVQQATAAPVQHHDDGFASGFGRR